MREIKFRAWVREGEWEEPDEMQQKFIMLYGDELAFEDYEPINDLLAGVADNGGVLMQFTGLKDKNGKEIYEGDILANRYTGGPQKGEIFHQEAVKWGTFNLGANGYEYDFTVVGPYVEDEAFYGEMIQGEVYVIGNIYENPELLRANP